MIAHALQQNPRTGAIPVNIFALDPVPGPGNFHDPNKVTLPPNVKNYTAVVQEDERRRIFKPILIDANETPGVKTKFYYMPGGHSSGVFRTKTEVGLIVAFLAHRFLQKHGTRLNDPIRLSTRDLCELYAKVRLEMAEYQSAGGGIFTLLGRQRRKVSNVFQDTAYFINDHHAKQFRKMFPQIWAALDRGVADSAPVAIQSALKLVQNSAPTTFLSLEKTGVI